MVHVTAERCRCSPGFFISTMDKLLSVMSDMKREALNCSPFEHYLYMREPGHCFKWEQPLLTMHKVESRYFLFGNTLVQFDCMEVSLVLRLQYEGQLVNINMHADSSFVQHVFRGELMSIKWPELREKLEEYATKNDSDSLDNFVRLYTLWVLNTVLLPKGNNTIHQFVYPYIDHLVSFNYYSWGRLVYEVLVDSMSKHAAGERSYFEGCIIGLLAWAHEKVNSLGYIKVVFVYPRFSRWIKSNIPKDEKQDRIMFEGKKWPQRMQVSPP